MKHRVRTRTLGRDSAHRLSMLRNMAKSLLRHRRITTTETRAKELSRFVEHLITLAKKAHQAGEPREALRYKREVFRHFQVATKRPKQKVRPERNLAEELFQQIAPGQQGRAGGYTRILRIGPRKGDGAPMALIEIIED
ncbi:MAG: 50S ribosomal protein L17 [Armatimonadetes bacterium]|nr:50S ribosomal protein L17 [Armatimonadota bacterium]